MIAILSTDPILSRMLTLEAKRGGFSLTAPENAALWLLDLDHPPRPLPTQNEAYVIGFSAQTKNTAHADLLFPLPYPTDTLQSTLQTYINAGKSDTVLRHLPGVALVGTKKVPLSPAEERLYVLLLRHCGETVSEAELLTALGDSTATTNVLQVHIYRLRRKLSPNGASYIRAVRGKGYRMALPARGE